MTRNLATLFILACTLPVRGVQAAKSNESVRQIADANFRTEELNQNGKAIEPLVPQIGDKSVEFQGELLNQPLLTESASVIDENVGNLGLEDDEARDKGLKQTSGRQLAQLNEYSAEIRRQDGGYDSLRQASDFENRIGRQGAQPFIQMAGLVQAEQFGEQLTQRCNNSPEFQLIIQHSPADKIPDRLQAILRILRKRNVRFEYNPEISEKDESSSITQITYPAKASDGGGNTSAPWISWRRSASAIARNFFGLTADRIRWIRYSKPRPAALKAIQRTIMLVRAGVISAFLAASAISKNAAGAALNPVLPTIVNVAMEFAFNWNPDANLAQRTQGRNYFYRIQPDGSAVKGFEQNEPFFIGMSFLHSLMMRQAMMLALNLHFTGPALLTLTTGDAWTALNTSVISVFAKIRFESWLNRFRKRREAFQFQIAAKSGVTREDFKANPPADRLYLWVSAGWMILQGLLAANNITGWSDFGQWIFYGLGAWGLWMARWDLFWFYSDLWKKIGSGDPALKTQTRIILRAKP